MASTLSMILTVTTTAAPIQVAKSRVGRPPKAKSAAREQQEEGARALSN